MLLKSEWGFQIESLAVTNTINQTTSLSLPSFHCDSRSTLLSAHTPYPNLIPAYFLIALEISIQLMIVVVIAITVAFALMLVVLISTSSLWFVSQQKGLADAPLVFVPNYVFASFFLVNLQFGPRKFYLCNFSTWMFILYNLVPDWLNIITIWPVCQYLLVWRNDLLYMYN